MLLIARLQAGGLADPLLNRRTRRQAQRADAAVAAAAVTADTFSSSALTALTARALVCDSHLPRSGPRERSSSIGTTVTPPSAWCNTFCLDGTALPALLL